MYKKSRKNFHTIPPYSTKIKEKKNYNGWKKWMCTREMNVNGINEYEGKIWEKKCGWREEWINIDEGDDKKNVMEKMNMNERDKC